MINGSILFGAMAFFERSSPIKTNVDDTENLICVIENAQNINKHTVSEPFYLNHPFFNLFLEILLIFHNFVIELV